MTYIDTIPERFNRLDLEAVGQIAFTNRIETKFILKEAQLPELMELLSQFYSLLVIEGDIVADYNTLYFDTPSFDFYLAHHNKRLRRYKVRQRTYQKTNKTFLEIKYQVGATKVVKERMKRTDNSSTWQNQELTFLSEKLPFHPELLVPTLLSSYRRVTLVNDGHDERITIDLNLRFSINTSTTPLNGFVIVELKQAEKKLSPAFTELKKMGLRPVSLSKYCLGINYLYPLLKKNNFKQRLTAINQFMNDGATLNTIA